MNRHVFVMRTPELRHHIYFPAKQEVFFRLYHLKNTEQIKTRNSSFGLIKSVHDEKVKQKCTIPHKKTTNRTKMDPTTDIDSRALTI